MSVTVCGTEIHPLLNVKKPQDKQQKSKGSGRPKGSKPHRPDARIRKEKTPTKEMWSQ